MADGKLLPTQSESWVEEALWVGDTNGTITWLHHLLLPLSVSFQLAFSEACHEFVAYFVATSQNCALNLANSETFEPYSFHYSSTYCCCYSYGCSFDCSSFLLCSSSNCLTRDRFERGLGTWDWKQLFNEHPPRRSTINFLRDPLQLFHFSAENESECINFSNKNSNLFATTKTRITIYIW